MAELDAGDHWTLVWQILEHLAKCAEHNRGRLVLARITYGLARVCIENGLRENF